MADCTQEQWEDGLLRVHCAPRPWSDDVAVFFIRRNADNTRSIARFSEFEGSFTQGTCLPPEPSFALPYGLAQNLMDELWNAGVRPADAIGGDAQKRHLEDMRTLLFSKLNVGKP